MEETQRGENCLPEKSWEQIREGKNGWGREKEMRKKEVP